MDQVRPRAKKGPKPKDPSRVQTTTLLPAEVRARAEAIAVQEGMALTNVIARLLCERLDLPVPSYCVAPTPQNQQELPLSQAS
jgi:hypothetical protein